MYQVHITPRDQLFAARDTELVVSKHVALPGTWDTANARSLPKLRVKCEKPAEHG